MPVSRKRKKTYAVPTPQKKVVSRSPRWLGWAVVTGSVLPLVGLLLYSLGVLVSPWWLVGIFSVLFVSLMLGTRLR